MEIHRIKNLVRFVQDFNLLRRDLHWSGHQDNSKFNRLKIDYIRSRTENSGSFSEDNFYNLKIRE